MPIQTRCPSCDAAIPTNAAWCSLCHSDLRARPAPRAATAAAGTNTITPGAGAVLDVAERPDPDTESDLEPDDEPAPTGRHSREPVAVAAARPSRALPSRGKHAPAGRRTAPPTTSLDLVELDLTGVSGATPERVDELTRQMLTHLSLTEPQPRLLDPDEFPGGRWGFAAAALLTVLVVLLVLYTVAGVVFG